MYMRNPEIDIGKSNGLHHPVWGASKNIHGLWFDGMQFIYSSESVQLIWIFFVAGCSPT